MNEKLQIIKLDSCIDLELIDAEYVIRDQFTPYPWSGSSNDCYAGLHLFRQETITQCPNSGLVNYSYTHTVKYLKKTISAVVMYDLLWLHIQQ